MNIKEFIDKCLNEHDFKVKIANNLRVDDLFNNDLLNENNEEKRNIVLDLIRNNKFEKPNPNNFKKSVSLSKHKMMLTDYSVGELNKMKLFKLDGFNIGYALKDFGNNKYSEIVAVHNNEPDVINIGVDLMKSAINNGGCFLDHFNNNKLTSLYTQLGFVEYKRDSYNPEYDSDGSFKKNTVK